MAQIIKHRRGTLAELNGVTLNNGELGIVTSSVEAIGDAVLKTAVVVGNTDGTNRLSIGRIIKGNATPNLSGITGGSAFNDMLYHETDAKTLKVLNTGGNTSLDLTGNIADGTVGGTLDVTGRVDAQAGLDVTGSLNIGGNTVLGDASGDSLTINAATINPANIAAGTDNTVVVYNGSTLVTDEIDSKVWDGNLVDTDGSGANNELVTWSDSDSIIGEGNLTFDGSTLTVTGNAVVTSHISSSANITGSAIYAGDGFYGDGSNLTGVAQDIDSLASYGAATIHQTDDEFLISDNGTEKRITFSNLEDSIFANISGDISIAQGGAATVTGATTNAALTAGSGLTSGGTFNGATARTFKVDSGSMAAFYSSSAFSVISGDVAITSAGVATVTGAVTNAALTAGTGISAGGTFDGATARTFALDLSELSDVVIATGDKLAVLDSDGANEQLESVDDLFKIGPALVTEAAIANGDYITFLDGGSTGEAKKEALADLTTLFAGDGLQAASSVMAVDVSDFAGTGLEDEGSENLGVSAAQTSITSIINASLGKIGTSATEEYITFGTANEVNTFIGNSEILSVSATGIDVTGNATISGNLTVNGTQTTISSSIVDIEDNIIQVNGTPVTYGGLHVKDATGNQTGSIVWDTVNNYWMGGISGSEYRVPIQDSTSALSDNKVVLAQGNGRIESSANITDDGSTVDFNDVDLTSLDKLEGVDANTYIDLGGSTLIVTKGTLQPSANGGNDLGATGTRYANLWLSGNGDIDGTLDVAGLADFQSVVDAQASLTVTGSIYVSAGASVAAASASLVSFKNDSNDQFGYLASADTQAVTTGLVGYNGSTGNLTISSVIDGGSF